MTIVSELLLWAQDNEAHSQYNLAMIYRNGGVLSINNCEAYFWFSVCSHVVGCYWSPDPESLLEELASEMTGLDVFLMERRSRDWIERHGLPHLRDDEHD